MANGPYQINGEEHVLRWGEGQPADAFEAVLAWLVRLSIDPVGVSTAHLDRRGVPGFVAHVPHTDAYVDYTVIEQYKTVMILDVRSTRLDDVSDDFS